MPAQTAIACSACATTLRPQDMSLETMAARCPGCGALVDLRGVLPDAAPARQEESQPVLGQRPALTQDALPMPLPRGLHVEDRGSELVLVRRWFSWVYIFLAFFSVVWNGFLVFWYVIAFSADAPLAFKLFPLLHVTVGAFISYLTLAGFVNRTTMVVERDHLTVRHGPLPWRGNVDVSIGSLEQLYCTEKISHGRNGTTVRYGVEAVLRDGRNLKVVTGLDERDQALYIEERMERHLGIVDRRVRSEMAR